MRAEFTDNLITGNEMIDGQHKELIDKINDLLSAIERDAGKEEAEKTLSYLEDYVNFHFSAEEKFQEEIGYPGIKEHKEKHEELRQTVGMMRELLKSGNKADFSRTVERKVVDWLYYHIQGFDRSVAEYRYMRENLM